MTLQNKENLKEHINFINLPIVITNKEGVILCFNGLFREAFHPRVQGNIQAIFDDWEPISNNQILVRVDQHSFLLESSHEINNTNSIQYIVLEAHNTLKAREISIELNNVKKEMDAILENSQDGIYIADHLGNILIANTAFEQITGLPREKFIGKNVRELVKQGVIKESAILKVLEQKMMVNLIPYHFVGDNTLATGIPVFNNRNEIDKVVCTIRDLTKVNRLYDELNKAKKLNSKYESELKKLKNQHGKGNVILESQGIKSIYEMTERIVDVETTILILGETGVGKEVLASHIYQSSKRSNTGEFIKINCGAIPPELLESELFGYAEGAFTGAKRSGKPGMFELAHKGVLFLDEIGELSLTLQVKLLRALQEKQIQRVGAAKSKNIDVRVIAATNRNLKQMVKEGTFREDLYYRLNVLPITIPPLRERKEDILPLLQYFLRYFRNKYAIVKEFDQSIRNFFYNYSWPGNIRELSNLVERLILTVPSQSIGYTDLPSEYIEEQKKNHILSGELNLKEASEQAERELLALAIKKYKSTYKIAKELDTSQSTIVRKLKKYNLHIDE